MTMKWLSCYSLAIKYYHVDGEATGFRIYWRARWKIKIVEIVCIL
jgi:hypothetical protein